jgi:diguanylate cyclase (GGDEF)-like protein
MEEGWHRAVRRVGCLQTLQVVALCAVSLATALVALLLGRSLIGVNDHLAREAELARAIAATEHDGAALLAGIRDGAVGAEVSTQVARARVERIAEDVRIMEAVDAPLEGKEAALATRARQAVRAMQDAVAGQGISAPGRERLHREALRLDRAIADWGDVGHEETREHVGGLGRLEARLAAFLAEAVAAVLGLGILMWWVLTLERRRMGSALESAAAQKEAVERVATEVAAGVEPERILELVAREAARLAASDEVVVCRLDGEGCHALAVWPPRPGGGSAAEVPAECARYLSSLRDDEIRATLSVRGWIVVPIAVAGRRWGAVVVRAGTASDLPEPILVGLGRLADLVTLAFAGGREQEEIVIETASRIFGGSLEVSGMLRTIVDAARRALGAGRASCYVHSADQTTIEAAYTTETDPGRRAIVEGAVGMGRERLPLWDIVLRGDNPVVVIENLSALPGVPAGLGRALGAGTVVGVRIEHPVPGAAVAGGLLATLFLSYREPRVFSGRDERIGRSLGALAALAIVNARLHSATLESLAAARVMAATDALTGLANHRAYQERLAEEYAKARDTGASLALVILDIDHFKRINDTHGHVVGDGVLAEFARRLAANARSDDLVARIGGEEFAWIMPGTDGPSAWDAAERLRADVARRAFGEVSAVTVSAGICSAGQASGPDEMVRFADGALYWAKARGRDAAYVFSPDVVEVLSDEERANRLARSHAMQSIRVLARAVDAKDHSTREHSERVADLAVQIAIALGWSIERAAQLRDAGLLHDVGKIGIPDAVLFKPGRLTDVEYELVKAHPALGAQIASEVLNEEQRAWVRGHHERFDGRGYPDGLAGDDIPEGARILALADSWDVMTSVRSYREAWSLDEALLECGAEAGRQFWPEAVEALALLHEARALLVQSVTPPVRTGESRPPRPTGLA